MRWLEAGHPLVSGPHQNVHAYSKETPHKLTVRHRYKALTYPAYSRLSANSPTTWARCRLPLKNQCGLPNWMRSSMAWAVT